MDILALRPLGRFFLFSWCSFFGLLDARCGWRAFCLDEACFAGESSLVSFRWCVFAGESSLASQCSKPGRSLKML
jgi:hypothetical protein